MIRVGKWILATYMTPVVLSGKESSYLEVLQSNSGNLSLTSGTLCTAISLVGLLGGVREKEERESRTLSLSCKPEWNTLLQSAKLAEEGSRLKAKSRVA